MENNSVCYPAAELAFDYSVKSAPPTSSWINGSTAALQSGDTDVILNYLWGGVYRNHVLFHLCPVEAKPLIQGGELLSEGHHRDWFNLHFSAIIGGELEGGGEKMQHQNALDVNVEGLHPVRFHTELHLSMWSLFLHQWSLEAFQREAVFILPQRLKHLVGTRALVLEVLRPLKRTLFSYILHRPLDALWPKSSVASAVRPKVAVQFEVCTCAFDMSK